MTLVHGETILGANLFCPLLASIRDLMGGWARAYESTLATTEKRPHVRQSALLLSDENDHAQLKGSADDPPAAA